MNNQASPIPPSLPRVFRGCPPKNPSILPVLEGCMPSDAQQPHRVFAGVPGGLLAPGNCHWVGVGGISDARSMGEGGARHG